MNYNLMKKILWMILLLFFSGLSPAWSVEITALHAPFQGYFRSGYFYPLAVDLKTDQRPFRGLVRLKVDGISYEVPVDFPPQSRRRVWLFPLLKEKYQALSLETLGKNLKKWNHLLGTLPLNLREVEGFKILGALYGRPDRGSFKPSDHYQFQFQLLPPQEDFLESLDLIKIQKPLSIQEKKVLLGWAARGGLLVIPQIEWLENRGFRARKARMAWGRGWILTGKISEDDVMRIPWVRGRMSPVEDRKVVDLSMSLFSPYLHRRIYLAFFLVFLSLALFLTRQYSSSVSPRFFWIFALSALLLCSLLAGFLPRQKIQGQSITLFRAFPERREILGETFLFFRALGREEKISFQTNLSLLKPLFFDEREMGGTSFHLRRDGASDVLVEKQIPRIFIHKSFHLLPGTLGVKFLSPQKIRIKNRTGVSFDFFFFLQGDRGVWISTPLAKREISLPPLSALEENLEDKVQNPFLRKILPYLKERYLRPEGIYLIAQGGSPSVEMESGQVGLWESRPLLWIFDLTGEKKGD